MSARLLLLLLAVLAGAAAGADGAGARGLDAWTIEDPGQGVVELPADPAARELSGLAWLDGDRWLAVSDEGGRLVPLRLAIAPDSGRIGEVAIGTALALAGSVDLEGVAVLDGGATVVVADERPPAVRAYRLADGARLRTAPLPAVFTAARGNLGFESLTADRDGHVWTANEEALPGDGPTSSAAAGTLVRLLRLDGLLRPVGQWAYRTDPIFGRAMLDDRGTGLSDLVALPDGGLLALERSYGSNGLRARLYAVDLAGAEDVSALAALRAGTAGVPKRLLWEYDSRRDNLEGAALGPPLADGSRSLVLIGDDGYDLRRALYALRLRRR